MTLIIAEAGVNHNGDEELAIQLINEAYRAGADIVKFQTFKAGNLVTEQAGKAHYQKLNTDLNESQLEMLQRLELCDDTHHRLFEYCQKLGIEFLSTAFDSESLSFLVNDVGIKRLKIPSGEITNAPLLLEHAQTGLEMIISTGMSTIAEVEACLGVIAFGYLNGENPSIDAFKAAFSSKEGQKILKEKVTLLHCTTEYPANMQDVNLRAMQTIADTFNLPVGYSDHTLGITVPIAATTMGACVIEKHFTLDKNFEGPDHRASLDPNELTAMVKAVRDVEMALGDGIKSPKKSEIKNISIARKSIVATHLIKEGEILNNLNISTKRPAVGLSPFNYWSILGGKASKNYQPGEPIIE